MMQRDNCSKVEFNRDIKVEYNDRENQIFGCEHYQRNAKILAPCCNQWVSCRFCHDNTLTPTISKDTKKVLHEQLDRKTVDTMCCLYCKAVQPIGQTCVNCLRVMGVYYCDECRFLDNAPGKDIYHCSKCGICRRGKQSDYFHCDGCSACLSIELLDNDDTDSESGDGIKKGTRGHVCIDRMLDSKCAICLEYLFTSILDIIIMKCGHPIHKDCFGQLLRHHDIILNTNSGSGSGSGGNSGGDGEADGGRGNNGIGTNTNTDDSDNLLNNNDNNSNNNHYNIYSATTITCPLCHKSLSCNEYYTAELDKLMETQKMPPEYAHMKSHISCNDCSQRSIVPYHFVYHKCKHCGSYNTFVRSSETQ